MTSRAVCYIRVSTAAQERSGLGLEAQRQSVTSYALTTGLELVAEYRDVESGKRDDRPELQRAIAHAKRLKAVLVIARLDRLSRSVAFISCLMEAGVRFVAVDNPSASELTLHVLAAVAQAERKAIGERTRAALAAARARGTKLGNPNLADAREKAVEVVKTNSETFVSNTWPIIRDLRASGCTTLQSIANALNARGIKTARRGMWTPTAVRRVVASLRETPARGHTV